jgi:fumarylacetoacetase
MNRSAPSLNSTHDPALRSWVESANRAGADFPIQNLPFAVFRRAGTGEQFRGGVAIGDQIVDLSALHALGLLSGTAAEALAACTASSLNRFMAMGSEAWTALRNALSQSLRDGSSQAAKLQAVLVPQAVAEYALPATIGDYTDFYASIHHATAVGRLFRPDNPLLPNYKWIPIGYHGRASSIRVSGQEFPRPVGQTLPGTATAPVFGPSKRMDYELEVGIFIGGSNALGQSVPIEDAEERIFGLCLLNDWSARDIQAWESQPLGPFLAKNFATTISPWIVTLEALAPFRTAWTRPAEDPQPLPYLNCDRLKQSGAIDMYLEASLQTPLMRRDSLPPHRLSQSNLRHSYWTIAQLVAHHTVNGCNLEAGDLFGSGTQSGPAADEAGSLLELTSGGKQPLTLTSGESRTFLQDGDAVILRAWCEKPGATRIGFGEAMGRVLPARQSG